jgi:hypothetical protein
MPITAKPPASGTIISLGARRTITEVSQVPATAPMTTIAAFESRIRLKSESRRAMRRA